MSELAAPPAVGGSRLRWQEIPAGVRAAIEAAAGSPVVAARPANPHGGVVVDWPHACIGAGWIDLLAALPSVAMHGGGDPERLWSHYPPARAADPAAATAVLAALVGFFLRQSMRPPPPNLPRIRDFQRAQGEAGLAWLRQRLASGLDR